MGEQPQTRRALRARERARHAIMLVSGVVAVVVLGAAVWFGKGLFTTSTPTGSPSEIPGQAAPLTRTPGPTTTPTSPLTTSVPASSTASPTASPSASPTASPSASPSTASASSPGTTGTPGAPSPTETATVDPVAQAVASCRTRWDLQAAARDDAYRSLSQWDRHLDIMNDLQAGKLTLAQAKAAWPATTEKAAENIVAFRTADKALAASKDTCAVDAAATGATADAVRGCAASMKTVDDVLARARIAIAPWETHLKDQSHFKAGGMTPVAAEAAWRVLWKKGLATLPGYQAVAAKGQSASCRLPA
ncbi:hypothetical protein [Terrabacter ginsenosidimutans]